MGQRSSVISMKQSAVVFIGPILEQIFSTIGHFFERVTLKELLYKPSTILIGIVTFLAIIANRYPNVQAN